MSLISIVSIDLPDLCCGLISTTTGKQTKGCGQFSKVVQTVKQMSILAVLVCTS
jgi:hypothetical protein